MVTRLGFVTILVTFLCVLVIGRSEETTKSSTNDDDSSAINKQLWEQIQSNCRLDFMQMTGFFEAFGLYLNEEIFTICKAMNSKPHTIAKVSLQILINVLPPHLKPTLLDCLQKENIPFHISEEEADSKNCYIRYLESFLSWRDASRRYLGEKLLQGTRPTPAPVPSPASILAVESPTYSPESSSGLSPSSFYESNLVPPAKVLKSQLFPPDINYSEKPVADVDYSARPQYAPHLPSNKHQLHVPVAVGIGITAAATVVFALILFFCYRKQSIIDSGDAEKDDRPLLALSLRNISFDFSPKFTLGELIEKETLKSFPDTNPNQNVKFSKSNHNFSLVSELSSLDKTSSLGGAARSSEESSAASNNIGVPVLPSPPLKPPPGRANSSSPGPPPPPPIPTGSMRGPPPPIPTGSMRGPPPPPPPKGTLAPRPPLPSPLRPIQPGNTACEERPGAQVGSEAQKSKLKPFFWDKVLANPDQSMVWHQIKAGSFQFDEEMIENLFGTANKTKNEHKKGLSPQEPSRQYIQILDSKKAQNISILLRALNVTIEEVSDALHEGNELPTELLQALLKMAPTAEEELKLRIYSGEIHLLGPAERFLKVLVDIPFAFKRMDSLLFKNSLQEEIFGVKESLATLEVASKELRNSRLFLKLLEAVLKTGNRMNDGTFRGGAQAFKLDTLLRLADVKGTDGKITLLHFVVQEIIRSEGKRAACAASGSPNVPSLNSQDLVEDSPQETENYYRVLGLEVVSSLGAELENVRKAAGLDADAITSTVSKLGHGLVRTKNFLNTDMKSADEESEFHQLLKNFVEHAEGEIKWLLEEEKRIMSLMKSTVDYFHGSAGKDEGFRLFVIVRDFLIMLDKACTEVRKSTKLVPRVQTNRESPTVPPPTDNNKSPPSNLHQRFFPTIIDRRMDSSSSDDESPSP